MEELNGKHGTFVKSRILDPNRIFDIAVAKIIIYSLAFISSKNWIRYLKIQSQNQIEISEFVSFICHSHLHDFLLPWTAGPIQSTQPLPNSNPKQACLDQSMPPFQCLPHLFYMVGVEELGV